MLSTDRILELFAVLNHELAKKSIRGEVYLAGGAVMCLVFHARPATKDIDALLVPAAEVRNAARAVAAVEDLPDDWLNDAVKGYFSENGRFEVFEELSHLKIYAPHPEYLFAMKCMALRLGEEFQDIEDVRFLLKALELKNLPNAEAILERYYALDRYPVRTRYVLEELLSALRKS